MSTGIYFLIQAMLYMFLLGIVYFNKERLNSKENKIYARLVLIAIIEVLLEIILDIVGPLYVELSNISYFVARVYCLFLLIWITELFMYIVTVAFKMKDKENKLPGIRRLFVVITLVAGTLIFTLPIHFFYDNEIAYTYGATINIVYYFSFMYSILGICCLVWNFNNIKDKRFFPLFMFLIIGGVCGYIQMKNPGLLLATSVHAFITFLMYFTIENPDMKMVEELVENRKIIERSSEEKSIFLFKMSQGIKEPSKNIEKEITRYEEGKNTKEKVDNIIQNIEKENGKINYLVNDVMGLTSFDGSKIKKVEGSYNIYSLLEDIKVRAKGYKKNDIDYTFTTVENIPKELIGDRVAIKQVLMSLIINAFNNTSKGYVHVDVNSITKYDVCRLVITIEDSGSGIEINKINEILNQEEELTNEEYLKLDKIDIDLPLSYKIIKSLGGTMYIRSEVGKGTSITITLDQYIIEDEDEKRSKRIEEYIKDKNSLGKILLVDDNEKEISKIKKYLNKKGYDVSLVMYGEEVIKRIKDKEKYDYIIIDDELETMSGISLLKELNKEKDNSKKIVILDKDKLFISDHYIEDGFNNYIDRENLIKELDRLF